MSLQRFIISDGDWLHPGIPKPVFFKNAHIEHKQHEGWDSFCHQFFVNIHGLDTPFCSVKKCGNIWVSGEHIIVFDRNKQFIGEALALLCRHHYTMNFTLNEDIFFVLEPKAMILKIPTQADLPFGFFDREGNPKIGSLFEDFAHCSSYNCTGTKENKIRCWNKVSFGPFCYIHNS